MSTNLDLAAILADLKQIKSIFTQNEALAANLSKTEVTEPSVDAIRSLCFELHKAAELANPSNSTEGIANFLNDKLGITEYIEKAISSILDMLYDYNPALFDDVVNDSESDFILIARFIYYMMGSPSIQGKAEQFLAVHYWLKVPDAKTLVEIAEDRGCPVECFGCRDFIDEKGNEVNCEDCNYFSGSGHSICHLHPKAFKQWKLFVEFVNGE